MKAIELNMPDDVYEKLENLASHDHQSVNVFAMRKLEEFARSFEDFRELQRRAQSGFGHKAIDAEFHGGDAGENS